MTDITEPEPLAQIPASASIPTSALSFTPPSSSTPSSAGGTSVTNVYVQQANPAALPPLSLGVAYVWWFFLGALGAHQFYLGKTGRAVGYIFTIGWLFVGIIIDLFTLPSQVRAANARRAVGIR